ncbi:hypothetical protein BJX70DRAFT_395761 [Aspergillus crustosus]
MFSSNAHRSRGNSSEGHLGCIGLGLVRSIGAPAHTPRFPPVTSRGSPTAPYFEPHSVDRLLDAAFRQPIDGDMRSFHELHDGGSLLSMIVFFWKRLISMCGSSMTGETGETGDTGGKEMQETPDKRRMAWAKREVATVEWTPWENSLQFSASGPQSRGMTLSKTRASASRAHGFL